jgi:RNA polymerase sigma-70 factor (ECF subfamily)
VLNAIEPQETVDSAASPTATASSSSDETLVSGTVAGDREMFGELVRRYQRSVRATCLAVLRDPHLANDAAQEAFTTAYRSLARLRDRSAFGSWLTTIARNSALQAGRRRRIDSPLPASLSQPTADTPDYDLLSAITSLPEQERAVVMLRYFEQHDVAGVAAILDRPIGTVTKQLSRAHERLRQLLASQDQP